VGYYFGSNQHDFSRSLSKTLLYHRSEMPILGIPWRRFTPPASTVAAVAAYFCT
jgi:hypothetical protein